MWTKCRFITFNWFIYFLSDKSALRVAAVVYKNIHTFIDPKQANEYTQPHRRPVFGSKILTVNIFDDNDVMLNCDFEKPLRLRFELEPVSWSDILFYNNMLVETVNVSFYVRYGLLLISLNYLFYLIHMVLTFERRILLSIWSSVNL